MWALAPSDSCRADAVIYHLSQWQLKATRQNGYSRALLSQHAGLCDRYQTPATYPAHHPGLLQSCTSRLACHQAGQGACRLGPVRQPALQSLWRGRHPVLIPCLLLQPIRHKAHPDLHRAGVCTELSTHIGGGASPTHSRHMAPLSSPCYHQPFCPGCSGMAVWQDGCCTLCCLTTSFLAWAAQSAALAMCTDPAPQNLAAIPCATADRFMSRLLSPPPLHQHLIYTLAPIRCRPEAAKNCPVDSRARLGMHLGQRGLRMLTPAGPRSLQAELPASARPWQL